MLLRVVFKYTTVKNTHVDFQYLSNMQAPRTRSDVQELSRHIRNMIIENDNAVTTCVVLSWHELEGE